MKITAEVWEQLSDLTLRRTRYLAGKDVWNNYSTSWWRMGSDGLLHEILEKLNITVNKEIENEKLHYE